MSLMRELVGCPLCDKRMSLHYLKYKHACKPPREITEESRQQAMETAVSYLKRRMGKE